jgi:hypothetical protein
MQDSSPAYRRVAAAFAHRESDRVPLWGIIQNRAVYEHVLGPENVGDAAEVPLEDKLRLHAEVYAALGIDISRAHLWPPGREEAGSGITWKRPTIRAGQVGGYQPELLDAAARKEEVDIRCRQIEMNRPHSVFAPTVRGLFCPVFEVMGLEEFCYAAADSPGEIERLMDAHTEHARCLAELYAARPEVQYVAVCDDMAYKGGLIFPPAWMRKNWRPRIARVLQPLTKRGIRVVFHSDGDVREMIGDLIELGFDGLNPLEPMAGMDLAWLKREFGRELTLIGGVDCSQLLPFGKPQEIREEVCRLLDIGAPGGGFIIGDSSQILAGTPLENVLAFYETVHGYGA